MAITQEGRGLLVETGSMGPLTEAGAGLAVVVLAIVALAHVAPQGLAAIATIVVGAALLLQVANAANEYILEAERRNAAATGGGAVGNAMAAGFLAGGVGIVLGILALLGINTAQLIPVALIIFGGALLLSAGFTAEMSRARIGTDVDAVHAMARQAATAAGGTQALIGFAVAILGILALLQIDMVALVLVGLLALGASLLLTSAAIAGATMSIAHR